MKLSLQKATEMHISLIWEILEHAIQRRKFDGSTQWQDGYPNLKIVESDIHSDAGYVLTLHQEIIGYVALFINEEPSYENIEGKWLTNSDFIVCHRLAIAQNHLKKGYAEALMKLIEKWALDQNIKSIKADTNFDNMGMIRLFEKLDYKYCGKVCFRGSPRDAFEKVL